MPRRRSGSQPPQGLQDLTPDAEEAAARFAGRMEAFGGLLPSQRRELARLYAERDRLVAEEREAAEERRKATEAREAAEARAAAAKAELDAANEVLRAKLYGK